eukprot:TRINITY_DN25964_c0_g1_i1.p1 TRINITY_DN25964_c0_g1~~TRINITY_DN25964_c0_g1_i1.p1  ORF type:complete len:212 (+),score=23.64 TRINITY_DN25964_c0_g1_i1:119-754(+)
MHQYRPPQDMRRDDIMEGTGFIPADWEQNFSVVIHSISGYDSTPGGPHCPPAGYKAPSAPVETNADPTCSKGIKASSDGVNVCCVAGCGSCGGAGCSSRPGGGGECCTSNIREANTTCAEFPAPCVMHGGSRRLAVAVSSDASISGIPRRLWAPTTDYPMIFMKFEQVDEFASVAADDAVVNGSPSNLTLYFPVVALVVLTHLLAHVGFRK